MDLRELLHEVDDEKKAKGILRYDFDAIALNKFMTHYNQKPEWAKLFRDHNSPLYRLF